MSLETELKLVFDTFDEDSNGQLSLLELKKAIEFCRECKGREGFKNEALVVLLSMINKVDQGDSVSFEDFVKINTRLMDLENNNDNSEQIVIKELFDIYDKDGNGKISGKEISRIHNFLGVDNLEEIDDDIELNFAEFSDYILANL